MACCGQTPQTPGSPAPAMAPAFSLASVPDSMILVEYTGANVGSTLWGGAGSTPSRRQYVFGANDADRVKYVDRADVQWFMDVREYGKPQFRLYEEPAQATAAAGDEADQKAQPPVGDEADQTPPSETPAGDPPPAQDATQTQQNGATVIDAGNMDKQPDPGTTAQVAAPLTGSIVNPDAPTVTEAVKAEPAADQPLEVAPKVKASHKSSKK